VPLLVLDSHGLLHEPSAIFGGYSPYFLLFNKWPIVGASVRDVGLQKVVDLDSPEEWARLFNERAKVFERHMPIAFSNLVVAQRRDMLTRSGTFTRKLQRFVAGPGLRLPEEAEGRLSRPKGWTVSPKSQVCRQWGPIGSRGTGREADQGSRRELCSLSLPQS
jgi:hypothetical protein